MFQLFICLEPRFEKKNTIIYDELDEFCEIMFVYKGKVLIGYEINKQRRYCLQYSDKCVVGGFGCTFNQRSAFIYATETDIQGFSIRKEKWAELIEDFEDIGHALKQQILLDYLNKIRSKVIGNKKKAIADFNARKDHQMLLTATFKNEDFLASLVISLVGDEEIKNAQLDHDDEVDLKNKYIQLTGTCEGILKEFHTHIDSREEILLIQEAQQERN